jgi:non-ribosomal peptide synthetase component E (peptide arylation enzyme)
MRGYQNHYKPDANQKVTIGAASAAIANAVGNYIQVVRIVSSVDSYVKIGKSGEEPVATSNDMFVKAGVPEYFSIAPGAKVAFLQVSGGGTGYVTEMTQ